MSSVRVVLADDHAVVRAGIANALKELPDLQIVGEVGDGPALVAILDLMRPDCLLLDVTMPDFEPISAIRRIRSLYPGLKILVVSAYDDDIYVQGLLGVGVNGYHLKDEPLSELRLAVQRVLAGQRWVCSRLVDKLLHPHEVPTPALALTARQRDLLGCLLQGLDNQAIAQRTGLSVKTVENHLTRLYRQLGVQSRLEAVHHLMQHPDLIGQTEPAPAIVGMASAHLTVLIVDDNMRYRTQMRRMIGRIYPQALIYEAENIKTALHLAQQVAPMLAFVDIVLGDESGIDCARRIRALSASTCVVLISAYPDREFHWRGLEAGAAALLDKKDLNAATLREVIGDVTARS